MKKALLITSVLILLPFVSGTGTSLPVLVILNGERIGDQIVSIDGSRVCFEVPGRGEVCTDRFEFDPEKGTVRVNLPPSFFGRTILDVSSGKIPSCQREDRFTGLFTYDLSVSTENEKALFSSLVLRRGKRGLFLSGSRDGRGTDLKDAYFESIEEGRLLEARFGIEGGFAGLHIFRNFDLSDRALKVPGYSFDLELPERTPVSIFVDGKRIREERAGPGLLTVRGLPPSEGWHTVTVKAGDVVKELSFYHSPLLLPRGVTDFDVMAGVARKSSYPEGKIRFAAGLREGLTGFLNSSLEDRRGDVQAGLRLGTSYGVLSISGLVERKPGAEIIFDHKGRIGFFVTGRMAGDEKTFGAGLGFRIMDVSVFVMRHRNRATSLSLQGEILKKPLFLRFEAKGGRVLASITIQLSMTPSVLVGLDDKPFVNVSKPLKGGERGTGYRIERKGDESRAQVSYRGRYAELKAGGQRINGSSSGNAGISGSVIFLDGVHPSPPVDRSFAVIKTGVEGAGVLLGGKEIGKAVNGKVVYPDLPPDRVSCFQIDQDDLPPGFYTETGRVCVKPWRGGGALVEFPVYRIRALTGRIKGASYREVIFNGMSFPVGREGRFYVEGVRGDHAELTYRNEEKECSITIPLTGEEIQDAGELSCE
jgi:hypothetical protein